jgi:hypothetical protein
MLKRGELEKASLRVASYEAEQVFQRGINVDWKNYDPSRDISLLRGIFEGRPKALSQLSEDKLGSLRLAAGMMQLWGTGRTKGWLPPDFETGLAMDNDAVVRLLLTQAHYRFDMEQIRESDLIKLCEIRTCNDEHVCEACRELTATHYEPSEVPELPYEKCTSETGCRCWVAVAEWDI